MRFKFAKFVLVSMCNKTFYSGGFHQVFYKEQRANLISPLKLLQSFSYIDVYESGATFNVLLKQIAQSISSNNRQCRGRILVMCDPSMNELRVTQIHRDICIDLSRLLAAHSQKGHTQVKIRPQEMDSSDKESSQKCFNIRGHCEVNFNQSCK